MSNSIYSYLDKNGLKVKAERIVTVFRNFNPTYEDKFVYTPIDYPFPLTEEEMSNFFVQYILDTTGINIESINNIDKYTSLNELPFIIKAYNYDGDFHSISLAFGQINGGFKITGQQKIKSLGNIEEIDGDLILSSTEIESTGKLRLLHGSFWISQTEGPFTKLKSLDLLEYIGGDLNIKQSPIENFGNLKVVGGNLNLRKTKITSLQGIREIGKNLLLSSEMKGKIDLTNITIKGKVKYYKD